MSWFDCPFGCTLLATAGCWCFKSPGAYFSNQPGRRSYYIYCRGEGKIQDQILAIAAWLIWNGCIGRMFEDQMNTPNRLMRRVSLYFPSAASIFNNIHLPLRGVGMTLCCSPRAAPAPLQSPGHLLRMEVCKYEQGSSRLCDPGSLKVIFSRHPSPLLLIYSSFF